MRKWKWLAVLDDGTKVKQPGEPHPFLGDLNTSKVRFFSVRSRLTNFTLDMETGIFRRNGKMIAFYPAFSARFSCIKRTTVGNGLESQKIVFGFDTQESRHRLVIEENGEWGFED